MYVFIQILKQKTNTSLIILMIACHLKTQKNQQLRQRQVELHHQQELARKRLMEKHRQRENTDNNNNNNNDDLEPDDSISNHADNDHAETDDDKLRRLSTAERREKENTGDERSDSMEIPVSYDDSSSDQPQPDILTIEHDDDDNNDNSVKKTVIRPSSAEVLLNNK